MLYSSDSPFIKRRMNHLDNTISVDGSTKDFGFDIGLHYQIATRLKADVHLIGSTTAKTGIETFTEEVTPEQKRGK